MSSTKVIAVVHREGDAPPLEDDVVDGRIRLCFVHAEALPDIISEADGMFIWDCASRALEMVWPDANRLTWVHVACAGVDRQLFPELAQSDVVLTNSRGVFERPIAEYVLGLVLGHAKQLRSTFDLQRSAVWQHRETLLVRGMGAVIVGAGSIGREIAGLLRSCGLRVSLLGRHARADADFGQIGAVGSLLAHVEKADYVVGALPLTAETERLFDRRLFAAMPTSGYFINVGRGRSVVESDVLWAVDTGQMAGAVLDVFVDEPLPDSHPFWTNEKVTVSPHMSGDVIGWKESLVQLFLENARRWIVGDPLMNVVDKQLGFMPSMSQQ